MNNNEDKTLNLSLWGYGENEQVLLALFKHHALKAGWTQEELDTLEDTQSRADYEFLIYTIEKYCKPKPKVEPKEVWEVLSQLGLHTHYLASKTIENWDAYDKSNYRSLQIKSGKLKKVYGVYYIHTIPDEIPLKYPQYNLLFTDIEDAQVLLNELVTSKQFPRQDLEILFHYKTR